MSKRIKWTLFVLALVMIAVICVRFGVARKREGEYQNALAEAQAMAAAGDYAAAQRAYEALGLTDEAADCAAKSALAGQQAQAREAEALLEAGEYEKAKAAFLALGDFEDAAQRARE